MLKGPGHDSFQKCCDTVYTPLLRVAQTSHLYHDSFAELSRSGVIETLATFGAPCAAMHHRGRCYYNKYLYKRSVLAQLSLQLQKQWLYKTNSFTCPLTNSNKSVAVRLQRKSFGGFFCHNYPLSQNYYRQEKMIFELFSGALQENPVRAPGGYYIITFLGNYFSHPGRALLSVISVILGQRPAGGLLQDRGSYRKKCLGNSFRGLYIKIL